jgi:protein NRD1
MTVRSLGYIQVSAQTIEVATTGVNIFSTSFSSLTCTPATHLPLPSVDDAHGFPRCERGIDFWSHIFLMQLQDFESILKEVVQAKRLSASKMVKLTEIALKFMEVRLLFSFLSILRDDIDISF